MASGYTTSGLSAYVETQKDVLVKRLVFPSRKGDTIANCAPMLGVKSKERINYLDVEASIQDGSACGFNPSGSTVLSDRDIVVAPMKSQDQFCPKDLLQKFAEYTVKIASNKLDSDCPFEGYIVDGVLDSISDKLERLVWQGATTANSGTDLIDGFITLASHQDSASTISVSIASGSSLYNAVKAVISAIPEDILDQAVVFLSPANYRSLIFELVEKNLYHFAPGADIEDLDVRFPGSEVRIHKTKGMAGDNNHIYASAYKNMVYATNLESDDETIRFWWSDDDQLFKYSVEWVSGVATRYPDMVVLGTYASE